MHRCLYDSMTGYYRRTDQRPFGKAGDFYTSVQLAPVFGELISAYVEPLNPHSVVDLGAGNGALGDYLAKWNYQAVDWDLSPMPAVIEGVVIANEFLDALPVHLIEKHGSEWREILVDAPARFVTAETPVSGELLEYAQRYGDGMPDGGVLEVPLQLRPWLIRIANALTGRLLVIDYGYDARELVRFPQGTLMSYRRHAASTDVLSNPGSRDITAHVNFTDMKGVASELGLRLVKECSLALWALDVFGREGLEKRWAKSDEHWRLQWKQIVFGLGETFRVLEFEKL